MACFSAFSIVFHVCLTFESSAQPSAYRSVDDETASLPGLCALLLDLHAAERDRLLRDAGLLRRRLELEEALPCRQRLVAAVEPRQQQRQVEVCVGIVGLRLARRGGTAATARSVCCSSSAARARLYQASAKAGSRATAICHATLASAAAALRLEDVAEVEGQHGIGGVGAHRRGVEALGRGVVARVLGLLGFGQKIVDAARLLLVEPTW